MKNRTTPLKRCMKWLRSKDGGLVRLALLTFSEASSCICKGPTCGEMIDLGPQKTFKWAAFEPSDRELYDYDRAKKEAKRKLARRKKESPRKPSLPSKPSSSRDIMDLSDSEDELPSFGGLGPSPKRRKKSVRECLTSRSDSIIDQLLRECCSTIILPTMTLEAHQYLEAN